MAGAHVECTQAPGRCSPAVQSPSARGAPRTLPRAARCRRSAGSFRGWPRWRAASPRASQTPGCGSAAGQSCHPRRCCGQGEKKRNIKESVNKDACASMGSRSCPRCSPTLFTGEGLKNAFGVGMSIHLCVAMTEPSKVAFRPNKRVVQPRATAHPEARSRMRAHAGILAHGRGRVPGCQPPRQEDSGQQNDIWRPS